MSRIRTRLEALERRKRSGTWRDVCPGLEPVLWEEDWETLPEDVKARYRTAPCIPLYVERYRPEGT